METLCNWKHHLSWSNGGLIYFSKGRCKHCISRQWYESFIWFLQAQTELDNTNTVLMLLPHNPILQTSSELNWDKQKAKHILPVLNSSGWAFVSFTIISHRSLLSPLNFWWRLWRILLKRNPMYNDRFYQAYCISAKYTDVILQSLCYKYPTLIYTVCSKALLSPQFYRNRIARWSLSASHSRAELTRML